MTAAEWRYHDRQMNRTLVYLPGWATDARLLPVERLDWNIITPERPLTGLASLPSLAVFLRALTPVTVLGWSLGGLLAVEFARQYPSYIDRLWLASLRPRYPRPQVLALRESLVQQPERALRQFYRQCFYPAQMADYGHFRLRWEQEYLADFPRDSLLAGLDFLAGVDLPSTALPCPTLCVHGEQDVVAPYAEARAWANAAGAPMHVLADTAHAVLWKDEFWAMINGTGRKSEE